MKIGFLFPGQGAQTIGMGKDIYDKYEVARYVYDDSKKYTGIDIARITFAGNEEELSKTQNTQLAILIMSLAILKVLKENGIEAEAESGLSLGEYTALIDSGYFSFEEGVKLVKKRGEYMQNLCPKGKWRMAAIIGMSEEQVVELCSRIKSGFVKPANFNCVGQIVISGEKDAVEEAETLAKEQGAKKVRILNTAGPFHTEKLIEASNELRKELQNIKIHTAKCKVVRNIDGKVFQCTDDFVDILSKHIIKPVKFRTCLDTMVDLGVDTFIEVGPGKTLSGFAKKIETNKEITILNVNNLETLENTIKFIKEHN